MRLRFSLAILLATLISLPAVAQTAGRAGGRQALLGALAHRGGDEFGEPYTGVLLGSKSVPASASASRGFAFGDFDPETNRLLIFVQIDGLQGRLQSVQLRSGAVGTTGPLVVQSDFIEDNGSQASADFFLVLTDPQVALLQAGRLYVTVRTSAFPNGEARAQIEASDLLSEVRSQPVGSTVTTLGYIARAKGRTAYVNDGSGGVAVFQTSGPWFDAVQSGALPAGTVVRISGTTSDFNGVLQIAGAGLASFEIANTVGDNVNGFAEAVSLEELAEDPEAYESVLVYTGATIAGGAGGTFAAATTYTLDDESSPAQPIALRIPSASETDIPGRPIPTDPTIVLGIVSQFTSAVPASDGYQILPIESYDVDPRGTVRVVHNSADPSLATIQIASNGVVTESALAFRSVSGDIDVPALAFGSTVRAVSQDGSVMAESFTFVLPGDPPGLLLLQGVGDPEAFAPNPDFANTSLQMSTLPTFTTPGGRVDLSLYNGATDSPPLTLRSGAVVFADNLGYDMFAFQFGIVPQSILLTATSGASPIGSFQADLTGLGGQSVLLVASGFLNPSDNQNGPALGLLAVRADGTTTLLPNLSTAAEDSPEGNAMRVSALANPVRAQTAVRYSLGAAGAARVSVVDVLGREVAVLADGDATAGTHEATLRASELAPGVYTLRLAAGGRIATSRVTVVR